MLEGLEISEILYSKVDHIKFRLDAEYYRKHFLEIDEKIKSIGETNLINIEAKLDCSAFYPSITEYYDFEGNGVPFLRVNEIKDGLVKLTESTAFLPQSVLDNNPSTIAIAYPGDLIIAKGGNTLAKVGLITDHYTKYALSRDIILVRTNRLKEYTRFFLWLFLHSEYGQALLWRTASQTGQPHLTLPSINEINLPKFDLKFEEIAERLYESSVLINEKSKLTYSQAENLLLETLGLADFQPSHEPVNVKKFSESFGSSGRLDAEYYQVKYDDLEEAIRKNSNCVLVGSIKTDNFRGLQPEYVENGDLDIINSKHILENTLDYGNFEKTSNAFWESQKRARVYKGDILTYTTGANIGRTQVYLIEDKALASNHVNILRLKEGYNPFYVGFVMNSLIGRMQTEKFSAGSAQAELYPKDIDKFIIPFCSNEKQLEIINMVEESFKLKKQSERLLEVAKTAVEMAIEQNEAAAMAYIKNETE